MIRFTISEQAVTPVPTIFLEKYMCDAPEEYVKLYLYGLHLAYSGRHAEEVQMEEALHLTSGEIESGLKYWESKGLARASKTARGTSYDFSIIREEPQEEPAPAELNKELYAYKAYNDMLNTVLRRSLSANDLQKIYDFTDTFGLPQDVVITMIEYCVNSKGANVSIAYLDKVAQSWAEEGIYSREEAEQKIEDYKIISSGVRIVMKQMGLIGKMPGQTERDYYNKWTEKWGFSQEAILFAMKGQEFAKDNPFKYLDAILRNLYEQGITTSRKISEHRNARAKKVSEIKEILTTLEFRSKSVAPRHERYYEKWKEAGYSQPIVLLACAQAVKDGSKSFEAISTMLGEWKESGLEDEESVQKYLRQQDRIEKKIKQIYDTAGIKKAIDESDRIRYVGYTKEQKMSQDVLLYAAEISSMAERPLPFLIKVIAEWGKNGVKTLDEAKQQNLNRFSGELKGKKAFAQHEYSKKDLENRKKEAMERAEQMYGE